MRHFAGLVCLALVSACGGTPKPPPAGDPADFVTVLLGENHGFIVPRPGSSSFKPGFVFLASGDGGLPARRGLVWEVCDPGASMADYVAIDRLPGYEGKAGQDKSGLNLAGMIAGVSGTAAFEESRYVEIEAEEVVLLDLERSKLRRKMREDDAFRACVNEETAGPQARMIGTAIGLKKATFRFVGDTGAELTLSDAEIGTVARLGGGFKINRPEQGSLTYLAEKPEDILLVAYRKVGENQDGLILGGAVADDMPDENADLEEALSLLAAQDNE